MEKQSTRRYDLDWLRVIVILTVFIYHSARFFNLDGWHIKNPTTFLSVEIWEQVLATWMMPLCFVISGASVFYALGQGNVAKFIKDKVLRLFVPLVVGIFTHSAWQVYLERASNGEFTGSFLEFYPHYFEGFYKFGGNFAWMGIHLWYLELLFVFSLVLLPIFFWLKHGSGQRFLAGLGRFLSLPGVVFFFLLIPAALVLAFVDRDGPLGRTDFGGWGILSHAWFFFSGFILVSSEQLRQSIQRLRWVWLVAAIALTISQVTFVVTSAPLYPFGLKQTDLMAYLWILAFLGLASRYLNFDSPRLQRANEAVLPFYILHQPVLLTVGYFVVQWQIPDLAKYAIIAISSFILIIALYEFLVRHYNILRFLFGMKPLVIPDARRVALPSASSAR